MFGQRLLILTLVAGLLLIQLTPMAQAKPGKSRNRVELREGTDNTDTETEEDTETEDTETDDDTDTNTDTSDNDDDDDVDAVECLIGIANFVIGQFNVLVPGILLGVSTCITVCEGGDAAACVACVAATIPAIPLIPTSIAGCA
jgi:hypothetical protein